LKSITDKITELTSKYMHQKIFEKAKPEQLQPLENEIRHYALEYYRLTGEYYRRRV
jgi:hypothetical protein